MTGDFLGRLAGNTLAARGGAGVAMTFQHQATGRLLDAYLTDSQDFHVVTRSPQDNDTQHWLVNVVGHVNVIYQVSSGRQLTSYTTEQQNFALVTRPPPGPPLPPAIQDEVTPRWVVLDLEDGSVAIRHVESLRYVDAYLVEDKDYRAVTRPPQNNSTQRWIREGGANQVYRVRQQTNGRFLDAYQDQAHDFGVVTREEQPDDTQRWRFTQQAMIVTLRQKHNDRFLDAHQFPGNRSAVTRERQDDDTQRWVLIPNEDGETMRIKQLSSGGFLDAVDTGDFRVFARQPVSEPDPWSWNFPT